VRFVVIRTVKVGQRVHRQARLVVSDVPEKTDASAVMTALETAGKATDFADAGIPWGNHEVKAEKSLPKGTVDVDDAPVIRWEELTSSKATLRRITLRLEPVDYDRVHQAARRTNTSIQTWCVHALVQAATKGT
jgi:hypothetical protein